MLSDCNKMKTYRIKEIFYSIQGEGLNAGRPAIFIRFAGCNFRCTKEIQGFDCDTDHSEGSELDLLAIEGAVYRAFGGVGTHSIPSGLLMVLTGGEPMLQLDETILEHFSTKGFHFALETNGSIEIPERVAELIQWITVSPKRGLDIKVSRCRELKYVLAIGQYPWDVPCESKHCLISPAFVGIQADQETIDWCVKVVKKYPAYRLSLQLHKMIGVQ